MPEDRSVAARYRFLSFDATQADSVWHGAARGFLLAVPDGPPAMVDGICPHRGGPLALGAYDCRTASLRCPWHGQRQTRRQLLDRAWPALRIGNAWTVVLPADSDTSGTICFRRGQPIAGPG